MKHQHRETGTTPTATFDTRVNLQTIADSLDISIRTVFRALREPEKVGATTRQRVLDACEANGYVPNLLARSLVSKRSGLVAALVPPFADMTFHETLHELSSSLAENGYRFLISHGGGQAYEARALDTLLGHQPEVIILTGVTHEPTLAKRLKAQSVRVVEMWNLTSAPIDVVVGFSNRIAARTLTEALIANGRRKIAFVGRPSGLSDRSRDRQLGYREALEYAGLPIRPELIFQDEGGFEIGARAINVLLSSGVDFDAVVLTGETLAAGALLGALAYGVRVPEDVMFAAFGSVPHDLQSKLKIVTLHIDGKLIGKEVGRVINAILSGEDDARRVIDVGFEVLGLQ